MGPGAAIDEAVFCVNCFESRTFCGCIETRGIGLSTHQTVFIVDDDPSVGVALQRVLRAEGYSTRLWNSAKSFLTEHDPDAPGCLVTDFMMPGMSGVDLLRALTSSGCSRPIIFLTGGDLTLSAIGIAAGTVSILSKPVDCVELLQAVRDALEKDQGRRAPGPEGRNLEH
jgi:FixJ family two-component response regulator